MMRWTRPDILNAIRELSKHMAKLGPSHLLAMKKVMRYILATPERGLFLQPKRTWNEDPTFAFEIIGKSDTDYAKDPDTRKSVSDSTVFLEGAPVVIRSGQQNSVTLSSAEAELVGGTGCAQDMLYVMRVLDSLGLRVKMPMTLFLDNKGAIDLANSWSVGGCTRHIEV